MNWGLPWVALGCLGLPVVLGWLVWTARAFLGAGCGLCGADTPGRFLSLWLLVRERDPVDVGAVPGEDVCERLGFRVVRGGGRVWGVVEHVGWEADCGPGLAGRGVADDDGEFALEEGEDGVEAEPAGVAEELGEYGDGD